MASKADLQEETHSNPEFFGAKALTRVAEFSLNFPAWIAGLTLVITLCFALGVPWIRSETTLRTFLGDGHPAVVALDRHLELFGAGYPVIVAFSCRETQLGPHHPTPKVTQASLVVLSQPKGDIENIDVPLMFMS